MQAWLLHAQIELCYIIKADFGTKALFVHRQALLDCEKGTNLGLAGLTCAPNLLKWGVYRGGKGGGELLDCVICTQSCHVSCSDCAILSMLNKPCNSS